MADATAKPVSGASPEPRERFWQRIARSRGTYLLVVPADARRSLARAWLLLALAAIIGSGVFSVLLVASRTPGFANFFPVADFFRVALVVHVDLSVLVWFVAFAGVLWSLNSTTRWIGLGWAAFVLTALGSAALALAPFAGREPPVMANYIPVLDGPVFLTGLVSIALGVGALSIRGMSVVPRVGTWLDGAAALRFGLNASLASTAVALMAFAWSWLAVPHGLDAKPYFELVFWGGGHVLQFTWTLLMMVAWLWLLSAINAPVPLTPRVAVILFGVALVAVFITPVVYLAYAVPSVEHYRLLTWLMRFGGGLAILPITLAVIVGLARARIVAEPARPLRAALVTSLVLFSAGGLIGFMIQGSNTKVPAHYHGCIVGITLAFMGVAYHLLPRFGYRAPTGRLATWQPCLYGVGQLMHMLGLVWSGGYGVQRKVAGAEQVLRTTGEVIGMGLMGLGGLVAIVGGVLFVVVALRAMLGARSTRAEGP